MTDSPQPSTSRSVAANVGSKTREQQSSPDHAQPSTCTLTSLDDEVTPYIPIDDNGTSHISRTIEDVIRNFRLQSASSSEDEDIQASDNQPSWNPVRGIHLKKNPFTENDPGVKTEIHNQFFDKSPYNFYKLMVPDDVINHIVVETNRYAAQSKNKNIRRKSRIQKWMDTNSEEIERFFGIIMWMGLCQLPSIQAYWQTSFLYFNKVRSLMSRNRFQLLLKMLHFNDNEGVVQNRLHKIDPLLKKLISSFQAAIIPEEDVCIDETLVPFRGRLSFRQYIKNKRHKFGIKLFKLCVSKGYTYNLSVYCGAEKREGQPVSTSVVMSLMNNLLDKGRTLYTDNYYTSVELAHCLLKRKTYLVGTLRANRKLNPKDVVSKKLLKNEVVAAESDTGVVVLKWKDKRDVLVLSTKHTDKQVIVRQKGGDVQKPEIIANYNKCKAFIDLSDQMKSYGTSLRRGVKWYRKLAIELLAGTAVVNAYILYQEVANEKISITNFKEMLIEEMLRIPPVDANARAADNHVKHHLVESQGAGRKRGRCVHCYKKKSEEVGSKLAAKQATQSKFRCELCEKFFCLPCFFETHNCFM